ncbi:unnamed protein product [Caenorhabditis sp. 36 PRJEB53466]|nr:unnamed protein product [Caenorhabditis sp. 36 PRJEB53466]
MTDLCADTSSTADGASMQIRASQSDLSIAHSSPRLESNATTSTACINDIPLRRDLSSELHCPLCEQFFDRPVMVTCGHSYCEPCIERHTRNTRQCVICKHDVGPLEAMIPSITLENMVRKLKNPENIETSYDDLFIYEENKEPTKVVRTMSQRSKRRLFFSIAGPTICSRPMSHKRYTIDEAAEVMREYRLSFAEPLARSDLVPDQRLQQMLEAQHRIVFRVLEETKRIPGHHYDRRKQSTERVFREVKFYARIDMECKNAVADLRRRERIRHATERILQRKQAQVNAEAQAEAKEAAAAARAEAAKTKAAEKKAKAAAAAMVEKINADVREQEKKEKASKATKAAKAEAAKAARMKAIDNRFKRTVPQPGPGEYRYRTKRIKKEIFTPE